MHRNHTITSLLLAGASACAWLVAGAGQAFAQDQGQPVPTVLVQAATGAGSYELDGVIQAVRQSTVAAQASGRIASFLVKAGDRVRAGQLLATVDDREAQVGVQRAQAQVAQAGAELRNAGTHLERTRDLQQQGFVSKAALDNASTQYQAAQAQQEQAQAGARQSGIAQGYTRVTAPMDGWVLQTYVQAGDVAAPGTPLLVVYAPQPLRAVVQVPASRRVAVQKASETRVLLGGNGDAGAAITPVNRLEVPSSDPVSQTSEWRMDLAAKDAVALLPGQQVRVRFAVPGESAGVAARLRVPASAIVRRGELTAVYVAQGLRFALRSVRLGADLGSQGVEVLAGLRSGERVALDSLQAAQPLVRPAAQ